jgi:hypothetical protein
VSNSPLGPSLAQYASVAHVARVYDYLLGGKWAGVAIKPSPRPREPHWAAGTGGVP